MALSAVLFMGCQNEITYEKCDGYTLIHQSRGATLGYTSSPIIVIDGYAFKDLNRNGSLDIYEDWRKPVSDRAANLAAQLPTERISGLMLYSRAIDAKSAEPTEGQINYIENDCIRCSFLRT